MRLPLVALISLLSIPVRCAAQVGQSVIANQATMEYERPATILPTLADLLTVRSVGSIWYDYAREVEPVSRRLSDTTANAPISLFVPINKAVIALHRKPHQGPTDDDVQITDEKTRRNVERWVSVHIIPIAPVHLSSSESYPTLLEGHQITFNRISEMGDEWKQYAVNGTIQIIDKVQASNGDLFFIDGVLDV